MSFNKYEIRTLLCNHFLQSNELYELFYWMNQEESSYGREKKDLFKESLEELEEKIHFQHRLVKKLLRNTDSIY